MQKILVPTDFSDQSAIALQYSTALAQTCKTEIFLAHVVEVPELVAVFPGSGDWFMHDSSLSSEVNAMIGLMDKARNKISALKSSVQKEGIKVTDIIEAGDTEQLIQTIVKRNFIDLIVLSGCSQQSYFLGSHASRLLRGSDVPVLCAKSTTRVPEKILFASDFSESDIPALQKARDFAKRVNATIEFVKINTIEGFETTQETRKRVNSVLSKYSLENIDFSIYNDVMVETGILHFVEEFKPDLIALASHRHKFPVLGHSLTEDLINNTQIPVLTIPSGRRYQNLGKIL